MQGQVPTRALAPPQRKFPLGPLTVLVADLWAGQKTASIRRKKNLSKNLSYLPRRTEKYALVDSRRSSRYMDAGKPEATALGAAHDRQNLGVMGYLAYI